MNARLLKSIGCPVFVITILLSYWAWLFRRAILVAFVAVQIWSLSGDLGWQIPAGMDVVSGPVPTGMEAVFWRAAAVLFVAMTLGGRQPGLTPTETTPKSMAAGLALLGAGVAVFGLLLPATVIEHPLAIAFALVYGFDLLRTAGHNDEAEPTGLGQLAGLALSGIGVGLGLQVLQMRIGLWGLGEPAEASLGMALFLAIAAFGAIAFAAYLKTAASRRAVLAAGPVYVCVAVIASFGLLAPLAGTAGLEVFLGTFGADLSQVGQVKGLLLIDARGLFLPALALGVLLASATRAAELRALGLGLGLGIALLPLLLPGFTYTTIKTLPTEDLVRFAVFGCSFPLAGWLLFTFADRAHQSRRQRLMAAGLLLPAAALGLWLPKAPVQPLSPWLGFEAEVLHKADTPHGLLTVETTRLGVPAVLLNRYLMTPDADCIASDQAQLRASLDYLAAARSASAATDTSPLRVLLAGQLTHPRMDVFREWSLMAGFKVELDWTVPWHDEVNQVLPAFTFGGTLQDAVAPDEARARLGAGHYDLVVSPATYGPEIVALSAEAPPLAPGLLGGAGGSAGTALSIVWSDSRVPLASTRLPARALLAGTDLEHLAVGLVTWPDGQDFAPGAHELGSPMAPGGSGLDRLGTRPELRVFADRAGLFARLAQSQAGPEAAFFQATHDLLALQKVSSPWELLDVRFEIEASALQALAQATAPEPTPFQRLAWNHLARVLVAKRLPQVSYDVLLGLLDQTDGPWPEVEYALARAYLEFLMPEEAAEMLAPLFDAGQLNLVPLLEYAAAEGQAGNWTRAAEVLTQALAADPHNHGIERHLAIAELQSGDPAGADRIRHLLESEPDDPAIQELGIYLLPGPLPPAPRGFDPSPLGDHEEH